MSTELLMKAVMPPVRSETVNQGGSRKGLMRAPTVDVRTGKKALGLAHTWKRRLKACCSMEGDTEGVTQTNAINWLLVRSKP